jgi:putative ABC transport system substrate-binding protein
MRVTIPDSHDSASAERLNSAGAATWPKSQADSMNRRESALVLLAVSAGGNLLRASAQEQRGFRPFRIGLVPEPFDVHLRNLKGALAEFGRIEGRDFVLVPFGEYGPDTQTDVEKALAAKVDLLVVSNLGYAVSARKLTQTVPVVMAVSGFPVEGGVADSLARPGGNVTGLTIYAGGEVFGKLVQMVHEVKPGIKRIGALMSYVPPFHPRAEADVIIRGMRDVALPLGIDLKIYEISRPAHVDEALDSAARDRVEALVLTTDPSMWVRRKDILRFATERRMPTIVDFSWADIGDPQPLLVYRADIETMWRQVAPYLNNILWQGMKPGELPIQLPARFVFTVNQKTAKAIGLTVPRSIRVRADQIIE